MNKSDYDKYYKKGGTYVIPVEIFNELFDELEMLSINYKQALEDSDKKENIIKEVREYIEQEYLSKLDDFERPLRMTNKDDWNKILEKLEGVKI